MDVISDAINIFGNKSSKKSIFEVKNQQNNTNILNPGLGTLFAHNLELKEDNQALVQENDDLKEELEEKDNIIEDLREQLQNLQITLKECEIRLSHTTEMYTREKQEKENASIAFNRILSSFTKDDLNSMRFLQQNMHMTVSPPIRLDRHSSCEDYSTNSRYQCEDDSYSDKELMNRRYSSSQMNTSVLNANQRTVYTAASHLITGAAETASTMLLNNNESYDFNPKDMEEMGMNH